MYGHMGIFIKAILGGGGKGGLTRVWAFLHHMYLDLHLFRAMQVGIHVAKGDPN